MLPLRKLIFVVLMLPFMVAAFICGLAEGALEYIGLPENCLWPVKFVLSAFEVVFRVLLALPVGGDR